MKIYDKKYKMCLYLNPTMVTKNDIPPCSICTTQPKIISSSVILVYMFCYFLIFHISIFCLCFTKRATAYIIYGCRLQLEKQFKNVNIDKAALKGKWVKFLPLTQLLKMSHVTWGLKMLWLQRACLNVIGGFCCMSSPISLPSFPVSSLLSPI